MVRTNRRLTRYYLLVVLLAVLLGGWLAARSFQMDFGAVNAAGAEELDWIDLVSSIGEEAIQLFIGLASK
jgi:hypothetical protein